MPGLLVALDDAVAHAAGDGGARHADARRRCQTPIRVACGRGVYGQVVRTLWWAGLSEHAWQLVEGMESAGVAPDAGFYASAIQAADSVGLHDDADRLYREAQKRGFAREIDERARKRKDSRSRSARSGAARGPREGRFLEPS